MIHVFISTSADPGKVVRGFEDVQSVHVGRWCSVGSRQDREEEGRLGRRAQKERRHGRKFGRVQVEVPSGQRPCRPMSSLR